MFAILNRLKNAGILDAENVSYFIERWINHTKTQLNSSGNTANRPQGRSQSDPNKQTKLTYDEKFNAVLR